MIVSLSFSVLAILAVVGAGGLLVCRRPVRCVLSFLMCATALAGLFLLLSLQYVATVQVAVNVGLAGLALGIALSDDQRDLWFGRSPWLALAALPLLALAAWSIGRGAIGESVLALAPVWAAQGRYITVLGEMLFTSHIVPFSLVVLLSAVGLASMGYVLRQRRGWEREDE